MTETMLLPTATRCARCGARVRWVANGLGKRVCVDAEPSADGVVAFVLINGRWVAERRRGYLALELRDQGHELHAYHHCEET